jgi:tRNA G46 methylase TrmB
MPKDLPQEENSYVMDAESATEMARLMDQGSFMTRGMGGLFPERAGDLSTIHDILDIGCGPGGWVHDVAYTYPDINVTGIEISKRMIQYARAHARVQHLDNAHLTPRRNNSPDRSRYLLKHIAGSRPVNPVDAHASQTSWLHLFT